MTFQPTHNPHWHNAPKVQAALPAPLDCETAVLLRTFLLPILETASSWSTMRDALLHKGYDVSFRMGRFILVNTATGEGICTGKSLGLPLRELSTRLGRPSIVAHQGGRSGELRT
jgi:hypothetical protein